MRSFLDFEDSMRKGQEYDGIVEELRFPNRGIVRLVTEDEEGEVFAQVKNCLPGQKVRIRITKKRNGSPEGRLLAVLEPAPTEIPARCPHCEQCGGCNYQTLPYEEQLRIKEKQVRSLLDSAIKGEYIFDGIKGSPIVDGYRNKMEFTFGDAYMGGPLELGMHKLGSMYDIVPVTDCVIMDEDYRRILRATRDFWREQPVKYFHRMRHEGYLRHLLVRKAHKTGEVLVALVTSTQVDSAEEQRMLKNYVDVLLGLHNINFAGILHTVNDSLADVVQSDRTDILYGRDWFEEELLGLRFKISEFSFFQNNSPAAEELYLTAREYLGSTSKENTVLYDLYSGTGTITQLMAPSVGKAIGVEIVAEAVDAAAENAKRNGISNCEFLTADVLKALDDIEEKPDYIILDPPRDGIHPKALGKILSYGVPKIVYISCKPTSLARDIEEAKQYGYYVERACLVDLFPGTVHVETVCLLSRKAPV